MRGTGFLLAIILSLPAAGHSAGPGTPLPCPGAGHIAPGHALVEFIGMSDAAIAATGWLGGVAVRPLRRIGGSAPIWLLGTPAIDEAGTCRDLARLAASPRVRRAEPDRLRVPAGLPNDPLYPMQDNLPSIAMPAAWTFLAAHPPKKRPVVAVVDTGMVYDHPDLDDKTRILPGYDFISDPASAGDGNGRDPDPTDPGTTDPSSSGLHGLHVSGIIAATTNNQIGIAAVAGAAALLPVRALGIHGGSGVDSDIADAIRWSAGLQVAGVPTLTTPADVINLSFASPGVSFTEQSAIDDAVAAGAIVVAAAGDHSAMSDAAPGDGDDALGVSPGGLDQVITVGAAAVPPGSVDSDGARAVFSNYGARVDLLAPGEYVYSTYRDVGVLQGAGPFSYHALSGTSQAAAQVSGAAALVRSFSPVQQESMALLLAASANPAYLCPQARHPGCGSGLLDVGALLDLTSQQASCACRGDQVCVDQMCLDAGSVQPSRYGAADVSGGCALGRGAPTPTGQAAAGLLLGWLLLRRRSRRRA